MPTLVLAAGSGDIDGTGNALDNAITGNEGANVIAGGAGADMLTGGGGADIFAFGADYGGPENPDVVTDFVSGEDLLDLSAIDGDGSAGSDNTFRFLGNAPFDGAPGALRFAYDAARDVTVVAGDVDGDGATDVTIELAGNVALTIDDFTANSLTLPLSLIGTPGPDVLEGGPVDDTLSGLGGDDILRGHNGNDLLDALEPLHARVAAAEEWVQQLERHGLPDGHVLGFVHRAHAALAELSGDPVSRVDDAPYGDGGHVGDFIRP